MTPSRWISARFGVRIRIFPAEFSFQRRPVEVSACFSIYLCKRNCYLVDRTRVLGGELGKVHEMPRERRVVSEDDRVVSPNDGAGAEFCGNRFHIRNGLVVRDFALLRALG